jgi:molybdenum cofactor cytidylyltransferase
VRLADALAVKKGDVVAFVGGGGKTSALFRLARELAAAGWRVLSTTTTRIAREELARAPHRVTLDVLADFPDVLAHHSNSFLYDRPEGEDKIRGPSPEWVDAHLVGAGGFDALLIEADGSRRLPFKAPSPREPALPHGVTLVVNTAGLDTLGKPLDEKHVYGADVIHARTGHPIGAPVTPELVAQVLAHPDMGLRRVPDTARFGVLLNQADESGLDEAREIAWLALKAEMRVSRVLIGAVRANEPVFEAHRRVGAVVLAAGLSTRMGQPKMLLPWGSEPIIRRVCREVIASGAHKTVVVTGAEREDIAQAVADLPVEIVFNPDYAEGEMLSSLKVGLRALEGIADACLIVLGDQPQIEQSVAAGVMRAYFEGRGSIVAPSYQMQRGHPVLIDRQFWPELLALPSGGAPRDVIRAHEDAVYHLVVETPSVLGDMDTPEDYHHALEHRDDAAQRGKSDDGGLL